MKPERFVSLLGEARAPAILLYPTREAGVFSIQAAVRGGFGIVESTLTIPGALDLVTAEQFGLIMPGPVKWKGQDEGHRPGRIRLT